MVWSWVTQGSPTKVRITGPGKHLKAVHCYHISFCKFALMLQPRASLFLLNGMWAAVTRTSIPDHSCPGPHTMLLGWRAPTFSCGTHDLRDCFCENLTSKPAEMIKGLTEHDFVHSQSNLEFAKLFHVSCLISPLINYGGHLSRNSHLHVTDEGIETQEKFSGSSESQE